MEPLTEIIEMLGRPQALEHVHIAGILCQLRDAGYTSVEYTEHSYLVFIGPHVQKLQVELPKAISVSLRAIFGQGYRNIEELLASKYLDIGVGIYKENIRRNHDSGYVIKHKPNMLKARISKYGGEYIATLNGIIKTNPGDWIITGVNGEQYPCDPEIFKELYDIV